MRDLEFDDPENYRSGGNVTPNAAIIISSWAYDKAIASNVKIIDNRVIDILCYHPGHTLVEKLPTIATKFRTEKSKGMKGANFMRQYYDVYGLLGDKDVQKSIGTAEYKKHKVKRFPKTDLELPIQENETFFINRKEIIV